MKKMDFGRSQVKIRGKRVNVDQVDHVTDKDVREIGGIKEGREIQAITPSGNYPLEPGVPYKVPEGTQFKDSPGIRKASPARAYSDYDFSYTGRREAWQNEVIRLQITDLERKFFKEELEVDDPNNPMMVRIPNFRLPYATRKLNPGITHTSIILVLPDQFPFLPPVGFYMPKDIDAGAHGNFSRGYHGAYGENYEESEFMNRINYRWYCSSIIAETWEPAYFKTVNDWRKGDNLWHVMTLITEVLSDFSDD